MESSQEVINHVRDPTDVSLSPVFPFTSPPATIGTSLIYYHKYRAYLHQAYKRGERDNEATKADEYVCTLETFAMLVSIIRKVVSSPRITNKVCCDNIIALCNSVFAFGV